MTIDLFSIFLMGVDYGQLLAEQERDSEDLADAFQGHIINQKYAMPSQVAPRRQPHSEAWREAKRKSFKDFQELLVSVQTTDGSVTLK